MRGKNLVKYCSIAGFILAEIYMCFAVLAPNKPGMRSRMFISKETIPPAIGVAPGAEPPLGAKIRRLVVASIFFGPFGAMVGLGVGLLAQGAVQTFSRRETPDAAPAVMPPLDTPGEGKR